jgi:predicted membrane protein DUF2085
VRLALRPTASSLRAAFVAAAAAWAALIVLAPFLASRPHGSPVASALILGIYGIGSAICHQLPERSIRLWTVQMPVCARCTGIYFGAVLGAFAGVLRRPAAARHRSRDVAPYLAPARVRTVLAIAVAPSLATLIDEWATGVMPSHVIRAAAGLAIGIVAAWLVVAAADNRVN